MVPWFVRSQFEREVFTCVYVSLRTGLPCVVFDYLTCNGFEGSRQTLVAFLNLFSYFQRRKCLLCSLDNSVNILFFPFGPALLNLIIVIIIIININFFMVPAVRNQCMW